MSSATSKEPCDQADLVSDYVAGTLDPAQASVVAAHISGCADCRHDLDELGLVVDLFVNSVNDVLRPSSDLGVRLARRVAEGAGVPAVLPEPQQWSEEWEDAGGGISYQVLATDADTRRVSMLVRLAPGAEYPPHRHDGVEELFLLCGELWIDDRKLYPGDYNRGEAGATDTRVYSETGCTCVLITSLDDELLR